MREQVESSSGSKGQDSLRLSRNLDKMDSFLATFKGLVTKSHLQSAPVSSSTSRVHKLGNWGASPSKCRCRNRVEGACVAVSSTDERSH